MSIVVFTKPNFAGERLEITADTPELPSGFLNHVSSATGTAATDRAVFFTRKHFRGSAMFRTGTFAIPRMGSAASGGKNGFGNTLASVRLTPIGLQLAVQVITTDAGALPTLFPSLAAIPTVLGTVVNAANGDLAQSLIQLSLLQIQTLPSTKYFNMRHEYLSLLFRTFNVRNHVNGYVVNTLRNAAGISVPACVGNKIVINGSIATQLGNTLAHELGHFLALRHVRGDATNLMTDTPAAGTVLTVAQIEKMHETIAGAGRAFDARLV